MPFLVIIIIGMVTLLFNMLNDFTLSKSRQTLQYTNTTALDRIESDVKLATDFLPKLNVSKPSDSDFFQYNAYNSWGGCDYAPGCTITAMNINGLPGTPYRTLLLSKYSTTKNPLDERREAVSAQATNCSNPPLIVDNPLKHTIIYFVRSEVLYRRTIINTPPCPQNQQYQKKTCPSSAPQNPDRGDGYCGLNASDDVIARDVTGFTVNYFTTPTSTSALSTYSNSGAFGANAQNNVVTSARAAEVTITTTKKNASVGDLTQSTTLRMVLGN